MVQCICASRMLDKLGGGDGDEVINAMGDVSIVCCVGDESRTNVVLLLVVCDQLRRKRSTTKLNKDEYDEQ